MLGAGGHVGHVAGRGGCRGDRRPTASDLRLRREPLSRLFASGAGGAARGARAAGRARRRGGGRARGRGRACRAAGGFRRAELVGFHGQTLAHEPQRARHASAGRRRALAEALDCRWCWDFRTADVRLGGQGAPLAPFFHFACARWIGRGAVAFLNLGGVGNLTWSIPSAEARRPTGACSPSTPARPTRRSTT